MGQLVYQEGDEKQYCRRYRERQNDAIAPLGIAGVKLGGQRENNQERDNEPAVMQADSDAEDMSEVDLGTQVNTSETDRPTPKD